MGPVEEGSKAIGGVVESLKAQPLSLALVVMNVALLALFYYIASKVSETRQREMAALYQEHKEANDALLREHREVREMLAHCVAPERK
jgi:hypothetical protein